MCTKILTTATHARTHTHPVELQLHELPEAAGVIVTQRLRVPKGLKDWRRLLDLQGGKERGTLSDGGQIKK